MGLILRSAFPEPPTAAQIADFRRHVRETGSPETWPLISTTRPPDHGEIVMLAQGVNVNAKRRGGGRAACPICTPRGDKWLYDGALIWCSATSAVYCIGPDCSEGDLRAKLNVARNRLAQTARDFREIGELAALAAAAPGLLDWATAHHGAAEAASARHGQIAKALPKWRRAISRALKAGAPAEVLEPGDRARLATAAPFLTGGWKLTRDLSGACADLRELIAAAGPEPDAWAQALTPSDRADRLRHARQAERAIRKVHDRLSSAAAFLSDQVFGVLARWRSRPDAPTEFRVARTATGVEVHHREEFWRGTFGIAAPAAVPEI